MDCGSVNSIFDPFCSRCHSLQEDNVVDNTSLPLDVNRIVDLTAFRQGWYNPNKTNPFKTYSDEHKSFAIGQSRRLS